jgi:hypothetical protein
VHNAECVDDCVRLLIKMKIWFQGRCGYAERVQLVCASGDILFDDSVAKRCYMCSVS